MRLNSKKLINLLIQQLSKPKYLHQIIKYMQDNLIKEKERVKVSKFGVMAHITKEIG